jgi:hypothetical protein
VWIKSVKNLDKITLFLILLLFIQASINLIGAFGPEIGFDALWYHLTLPKIWLQRTSIDFIQGPVFKYSVMPKLTETIYAAALSFGSESLPKVIHFTFGILTLVPLYKLAKSFLSRNFSLLVLVIFYSNLIVGWESTSAYVDLSRTFFEILALQLFIDRKYAFSAITLGLAITVKLVALSSLPIFILLLLNGEGKNKLNKTLHFIFFTLFIPAPWLLFSAINTGNPFYPLFSPVLGTQTVSFNPKDVWDLFTANPDPVSPMYIISAPLIFLEKFTKQSRGVSQIFIYAGISLFIWYLSPRAGGARFILPYLPAFSICTTYLISELKDRLLQKFLLSVCILVALSSTGYRLLANYKYLQVFTKQITRQDFLIKHLSFDYGDYIDVNNYLFRKIPSDNTILVAGINNLYYIPATVNFTHISELQNTQKMHKFNYLLLRQPDAGLNPDQNWELVSSEPITNSKIYKHK